MVSDEGLSHQAQEQLSAAVGRLVVAPLNVASHGESA
jgi:hypothetical protein